MDGGGSLICLMLPRARYGRAFRHIEHIDANYAERITYRPPRYGTGLRETKRNCALLRDLLTEFRSPGSAESVSEILCSRLPSHDE